MLSLLLELFLVVLAGALVAAFLALVYFDSATGLSTRVPATVVAPCATHTVTFSQTVAVRERCVAVAVGKNQNAKPSKQAAKYAP